MKNPVSARSRIYRITLDAMMIAIFVAFSMVPSELSWASLPVILSAFLFGPVDAVLIAACGSFIEQMWYGLSFASFLWMLPWLVFALFIGICAALINRRPRFWKMALAIVCAEILLSVGNTTALLGFGYVSVDPAKFSEGLAMPFVVILTYIVRMPQGIIRALLSSLVVPILLPPLRKVLNRIS